MALGNLSILDKEESSLAKVLLKNNLLNEEGLNRFLDFRLTRSTVGKKFIGGTLLDLGYVVQADLEAYVKENHDTHTTFLHKIADEGFLTHEQFDLVLRKSEETGGDVVTAINDLNIMTRENYIRYFNNREHILRLGEWLVKKKKITKEQLDYAVKAQSVNSLEDYLLFHNLVTPEVIDRIKEKLAEAIPAPKEPGRAEDFKGLNDF